MNFMKKKVVKSGVFSKKKFVFKGDIKKPKISEVKPSLKSGVSSDLLVSGLKVSPVRRVLHDKPSSEEEFISRPSKRIAPIIDSSNTLSQITPDDPVKNLESAADSSNAGSVKDSSADIRNDYNSGSPELHKADKHSLRSQIRDYYASRDTPNSYGPRINLPKLRDSSLANVSPTNLSSMRAIDNSFSESSRFLSNVEAEASRGFSNAADFEGYISRPDVLNDFSDTNKKRDYNPHVRKLDD